MAISVSQAFKRTSANPVDESLTLTKAQMLAINDNLQPNKYFAICLDDGELYIYDKSATPNAETGKFKKYGGGHAVEDSEGTALTQRDTMQFGDGLNATDDSENETTVVEPNLMSAADMDDVVTPLPSVQSRYHKYSTEEHIVGEWVDGKPIYEITALNIVTTDTNTTTGTSISIPFVDIGLPLDLERVVSLEQVFRISNSATQNIYVTNNAANSTRTFNNTLVIRTKDVSIDVYNKQISILNSMGYNMNVTFTVRYTKTTS